MSVGIQRSSAREQQLRAEEMVRRRLRGDTLQAIADDYGLTRERVRQITANAGGPDRRDMAALRARRRRREQEELLARTRAALLEDPALTLHDLAERFDMPVGTVADLLPQEVKRRLAPAARDRRPTYSDPDILRALRTAARLTEGPLSHSRYDELRNLTGGPSSMRILQRFGSWRAACAAAGVATNPPVRAHYERRWNHVDLLRWVRRYLATPGCRGTYDGYDRFARVTPGAPSSQTVRNYLGPWSKVKADALRIGAAA